MADASIRCGPASIHLPQLVMEAGFMISVGNGGTHSVPYIKPRCVEYMLKSLSLSLALIFCNSAFAGSLSEKPEWNGFFAEESVNGVFVLCKGNTGSCVTNNKARAASPYSPASTFKIANALIALESGAIKDWHEIFKWNGKPRGQKQWEKDFTLRGAIQASAVPVFQQLARTIGEKKMGKYLHKFAYGNEHVDGGVDHFWLDGQLKISAIQQVAFLEKLYLGKLPIATANQLIVADALVAEADADYVIRAKTGYGSHTTPGIGWWVGWMEKDTDVYFFAANIDIAKAGQLPARKAVPTKIMQHEGVLP